MTGKPMANLEKRTTDPPAARGKARSPAPSKPPLSPEQVLARLRSLASEETRLGMTRFAIPNENAFGVAVGAMRSLATELGRNQALAEALWKTGWYEARIMAAFLGEPDKLTPRCMESWCRELDNWALCDTHCIHLFDRTPFAYDKVVEWAERVPEFEKRASFALLASLAGRDKRAEDARFLALFPLLEQGAHDPRNFVKKAVSWALRRIGARSSTLRAEALRLATDMAASRESSVRWVGKDAVRDLSRPAKKAR